ncbi:MAG TPA: class I SAM-dependent methyltransferase [Terriglobia bacterium]|nr:class I SAM-dependent methyltransferase [Terriglobia bacterium]
MKPPFQWIEAGDSIACRSPHGLIFKDTPEHWRDALCRLMNLTPARARDWVELVGVDCMERLDGVFPGHSVESQVDVLARASHRFFQIPNAEAEKTLPKMDALNALGKSADRVWIYGLQADASFAVVGNAEIEHGILVHVDERGCHSVSPAEYEETYFEGERADVGYGNYRAQAGWRMEKAARLARQICGIGRYVGKELPAGASILDVGSGYGYFRMAASKHGWRTDGIEISRHAISAAREGFGLDTFAGTMETYSSQSSRRYDLITLFDTLEHVKDPIALLKSVETLLDAGGLCVIRTPNLVALEARVFRNYYHSLKKEHLHYFSPHSLCFAMQSAGLEPAFLTSESHLLRGFFQDVAGFARLLAGSDLFAVARKPLA